MNEAFDLMLGVYRAPVRAPLLAARALPQQILEVIRVAGGDGSALAEAQRSTGLGEAELGEAAVLLLHHLLFFDAADHYRVLGVDAHADDALIKQHYRALMRWLHPDRAPDNLHSVFAERVNRAWNALRTPQRRDDYDSLRAREAAQLASAEMAATAMPLSTRPWRDAGARPWLSGRLVRRLPQVVAAISASIALALLALLFWLRPQQAPAPTAAATANARSAPATPTTTAPTTTASATTAAENTAPANIATATLSRDATASPAAAIDQPGSSPAPPAMLLAAAPYPAGVALQTAAPETPRADTANAPVKSDIARVVDKRDADYALPSRAVPASRAVSVASATPRPAVAAAATALTQDGLSQDEISAFIQRFEYLYAGSDVEPFLALFGAEVKGNGDDGLPELSNDYRRLFSTYARRSLRLSALRWQIDGDNAVGHGHYDAQVDAAQDSEQHTRGQILLGLRRDGGRVRIIQLHHSVSR
jgi:DnaJ domain